MPIDKSVRQGNLNIVRESSDRDADRFLFHFDAYGSTHVLVYALNLEDAFDAAGDWLADHAPDMFCDDSVHEAYAEAIAAGKSEDDASEEAIVDTTLFDNGHYIPSSEWHVLENPGREDVLAAVGG